MAPKSKKAAAAATPKSDVKRAAKSASKKPSAAEPSPTSPAGRTKRARTDSGEPPIQWGPRPTQEQVNKLFGVSAKPTGADAAHATDSTAVHDDAAHEQDVCMPGASLTACESKCDTQAHVVDPEPTLTPDHANVHDDLCMQDSSNECADGYTDEHTSKPDGITHDASCPVAISACPTTCEKPHTLDADPDAVQTARDKFEETRQHRMEKLQSFMDWPLHALRKCWDAQDKDERGTYNDFLDHLQEASSSLTVSTAFSGIDTPAVALAWLHCAVCHELGVLTAEEMPAPGFSNIWGVEWYSKSQDVLMSSPHGPHCLFSDISEFWHDEIATRVNTLIDQGQLADVMKVLMRTTPIDKIIKPHATCIKCGKACEVTQP